MPAVKVTQQITPMTTPFAITIPMSRPSAKVITHRARKPATVVMELADDGLERIGNRMSHGPLFVSREPLLVGLVAVQQENGVVHRHAQLQHCGQRLCDIGNIWPRKALLPILYTTRHADAEKEQQRYYQGVHRQVASTTE